MRASTARLTNSSVRLADIAFPQVGWLVHRTRLAFIHLENLLAFAKRDRDGRVDGFITAHLPDECLLLFFRKGEAVNAASLHTAGRQAVTINEALRRMRTEVDRGDLSYSIAPLEQLAWMYQSCAALIEPRAIDPQHPDQLFPLLQREGLDGVLELISNGRVSYLLFEQGRFVRGYFCDKNEATAVPRYLESLMQAGPDGALALSANVFAAVNELPAQAAHTLINTYRELYWRIVDAVDAEVPGEGRKRAHKVAVELESMLPAVALLAVPRGEEVPDAVVRSEELPAALAEWARRLLEDVEIMMPGTATRVLKESTREHRYVLQAAGFYDGLAWPVSW